MSITDDNLPKKRGRKPKNEKVLPGIVVHTKLPRGRKKGWKKATVSNFSKEVQKHGAKETRSFNDLLHSIKQMAHSIIADVTEVSDRLK